MPTPYSRWSSALFLCVASLAVACDDDGSKPYRGCEDPTNSCDVRESACQKKAIAMAACLRGDDPSAVDVDISVVAFDTLLDELTREAQTEEPEPTAAREQTFRAALSLIGLSRPATSASDDLRDVLTDVAAFYDDQVRAVTVIDHGGPLDDAGTFSTLVHEIVHALQDLSGDFASERRAKSYDQALARRAIIEGEATLLDLRAYALAEGLRVDELDFDAIFSGGQEDMLGYARESDDPWLEASLLFPYVWGGAYVLAVDESEGRRGIRALYGKDEPASTRQVLLGNRSASFQGEPWLADLDSVAIPTLEDLMAGPEAVSAIGSWFALSLASREELDLSYDLAEQLRGDRLSAFSFEGESGRETMLVWRMRLSSAQQAKELAFHEFPAGVSADREGSDVWITAVTSGLMPPVISGWQASDEEDPFVEGEAASRGFSCMLSARSSLHLTQP